MLLGGVHRKEMIARRWGRPIRFRRRHDGGGWGCGEPSNSRRVMTTTHHNREGKKRNRAGTQPGRQEESGAGMVRRYRSGIVCQRDLYRCSIKRWRSVRCAWC